MNDIKIAIIGGTGLDDPDLFEHIEDKNIETPYGKPSDPIKIAMHKDMKLAFLARHGKKHNIQPSSVNYRANIWALKELGVERIISCSAVGSLQELYKPGDIVFPDQFIDFTKKRDYTFYDNDKVYHISMAEPFCQDLRSLFFENAKKFDIPSHDKGRYICIEGPRFSAKAESKMFQQHADIIGMTLVPEITLARELEMCYLTIATVTDYDTWKPQEGTVTTDMIIETLRKNTEKVKKLLVETIPQIPEKRTCECKDVLKSAGASL